MTLLPVHTVQYIGGENVAGWLTKGWYYINNQPTEFLIKGNTKAQIRTEWTNGYEPYSEVMASNIAEFLGIPHIPYYLAEASHFAEVKSHGIKHVSVCPSYHKHFYNTKNLADYCLDQGLADGKGAGRRGKFKNMDVYDFLQTSGINLNLLYKILMFDALVGNRDRHLGNIELYLPKYSNEPPHFVPLFDNGAALLGVVANSTLALSSIPYLLDKAQPFASNHRTQIKLVPREFFKSFDKQTLYNGLVNSIEPVRPYLPTFRYKAILRFLHWRVRYLEEVMLGVNN